MHRQTNVKNKYVQMLTHSVKFQISLEISREILSASWQYGNNLCALPTSSFLLVCKRFQILSREMKNCFRVFFLDEMLRNTDLEAYILLL